MNIRLPPLIQEFLRQQALANPKYSKPKRPKPETEWVKTTWLVWGALFMVGFLLTLIISRSDRLFDWLMMGLSVVLITLGGIGAWWWLTSVYQPKKLKRFQIHWVSNYQGAYRQYSKAEKLLTRQQHRKLYQLLSKKQPKLITQSILTPEEKKLKLRLKKKFPFLQINSQVKCLIKEESIKIEWVIISQRTKVILAVFFEDEEKDYYLKLLEDNSDRERLLDNHCCLIEVNSTESLIKALDYLVNQIQLL